MKSLENKGEGVDHHSFCDMIINVEKKQVSKSVKLSFTDSLSICSQ